MVPPEAVSGVVQVRASHVDAQGKPLPIDPKVEALAELLMTKGPESCPRTDDRVVNTYELHHAIREKYKNAEDDGDQLLYVEFDQPRLIDHIILENRVWLPVSSNETFGGVVYDVVLDDGSTQSIGVQYA